MPTFRPLRALTAAAAAATLLATFGAGSASAADRTGQDLINRTDGSRLALYGDSTAEGATAVSLRDPGWKHKTEVWDEAGGRWENGRYTLTFKNQAADKCLQPADAKPTRGTTIVVRTCDGSDLQRWVLRPEGDNNSRWWIWQPKVDTGLAMTLNRYNDGSWNTLYLDTSYPSADRLWHLADDNTSW
ncbi:RICIN domain-containing protein [Streptomyces sp. NBC_01754]|uniref:RICIN domain-containing protein n=1 Tax=Streptomyces sp. NBC_01754 TaxID=2975930 RepID=UPI002DDB7EA8|nr:RICIN domain-containing protein [Streptomyces sp. NBC_01754]WSC91068.1 RICIN domain-containing protein [Streptomyces sp. NBC_01754]